MSGCAGLGDGIRDILRALTAASKKYPICEGIDGAEFRMGLQKEAVCALINIQYPGKLFRVLPWNDACCEHNEISYSVRVTLRPNRYFAPSLYHLNRVFKLPSPVDDTLSLHPVIEFLETLPKRPYVSVIHDHLRVGNLLLHQMGLLRSVHAAYPGAVLVTIPIARTHTLDKNNFPRFFTINLDVTTSGTRRRDNPL